MAINITVRFGGYIGDFDPALSATSTNAVQNKVVTKELNSLKTTDTQTQGSISSLSQRVQSLEIGKLSKAEAAEALASKADKTNVDTELARVYTKLNTKAERVYVDTELAKKADRVEDIDTQIVDVEIDINEAMQTPNGELEALLDMYRQICEDSDQNNNPDLLSYYARMSGKKMVAHFTGTEQADPDTGIQRDFIPLPWTIYLYNNRDDNNTPLLYIIFDYDTTQYLRDANVNDNLGISGDILGLVCSYENNQFEYTTSTPWRQQ